ncbi:MAG: ABC transporter permease subunit, partial [Planifilum fulgidum]
MNRWPQVWDDPVLNKEVRQRMRFSRTPWIVFLYLGIMGFLIFTYMFLMEKEQFLNSEENRFLFMGLALIHLMILAFVVPGLTAGTISGERERQTLSVLLTLPLS